MKYFVPQIWCYTSAPDMLKSGDVALELVTISRVLRCVYLVRQDDFMQFVGHREESRGCHCPHIIIHIL